MTFIFTLVSDSKSAVLHYLEAEQTVLLKFKSAYVPMETFQRVMNEIEQFAEKHPVTKMVFDKSNLTVFHQPSMEWYHVVWKPQMSKLGLNAYRKILPQDRLFQESVKIGREKIKKNHPHFSFDQFDIRYCASVEEALAS